MNVKKPSPQRRLEIAYVDGFSLTRTAPARWTASTRAGLTEEHFVSADTRAAFQNVRKLFVENSAWTSDYRAIDTVLIADACAGIEGAEIEKLIKDPNANGVNYAVTVARLVEEHKKRVILRDLKALATNIEKTDSVETAILLARNVIDRLGTEVGTDAKTVNTSTPIVTASAWLTEPDEPEQPIMEGVFDAADRVAIVGQSKARKSFYALQLAVAVSTGTGFLGVPTVKRRVLLVNGEIVARSYKKRLRRMIEKLALNPAALADLVVVNASESADVGGFAEILALAKKHGADVALIDPAYLLLGDEIDQQQVKQAVRDMKRFAAEGITLVTVFHATKGRIGDKQAIDRISGSGIFARDCSTMLTLCEHASEPDHVVVQSITRNYAPVEPITVRFEDGAFVLADGVAAIEKTSATKPRREIPLADALECFTAESVRYTEAVKLIMARCSCGENKAKCVLRELSEKKMVSSMPVGRVTYYSRDMV